MGKHRSDHLETTLAPGQARAASETVPVLHGLPGGAAVRRFPPVLQFLTRTDPFVEQQLHAKGGAAFREGRSLEQICSDIYRRAQELAYDATIGVQEVYSANMPSFQGQTVVSALLMIDLRPAQDAPGGSDPHPVRRVG